MPRGLAPSSNTVPSRFFIISSPRSRTAWIANYLSHGNVACLHEGLMQVGSLDELEEKLAATGAPVAGIVDTLGIYFYPALKQKFPDALFLWNYRDWDEIVASFRHIGTPQADIDACLPAWERLGAVIEQDFGVNDGINWSGWSSEGEALMQGYGFYLRLFEKLNLSEMPEWLHMQRCLVQINWAPQQINADRLERLALECGVPFDRQAIQETC